MKAALLLVAALVAVVEVYGQPEGTTTVSIGNEELSTGNITAENIFLGRSSYTEDDDDTICVAADNKFYLYANSLKLYSCYNQLPKVYVVKPKSQCKPYLSDCPRN
ncbi:uncharacterized protein LOC124596312 [Schistocerca americana]|uniref:uncharacterized protein LOC124596312 n=1 Tax=Schistocerca americana TaxID=7009 RepID=UPI001F4FD310|nr:uncharacterized protein LOC124596312 [Schistocerca americana]XP_047109344.1 uncharacterized protein LOC124777851 [Schistocerca piceifrons]XP_047109346.1 uncharacterized protein LOC124777854 [Schistocerca piceifrons]XP_049950175.1 uncharacterized protein LOC126457693 isoform X1 [Schistocerca serialis cubense]XP_049950177.1 uncharacterized protein LOC126457693 isoform X2 [Schistocerca serialis cubense]XP_049950178.1 uncharacterized protein LOC126457693 isoform X3 [Schistocerca serialis cubens